MQYHEILKGASDEEARYLSQFRSACIVRAVDDLSNYQFLQFRNGAYVKASTRRAVELFYVQHLEETAKLIQTLDLIKTGVQNV